MSNNIISNGVLDLTSEILDINNDYMCSNTKSMSIKNESKCMIYLFDDNQELLSDVEPLIIAIDRTILVWSKLRKFLRKECRSQLDLINLTNKKSHIKWDRDNCESYEIMSNFTNIKCIESSRKDLGKEVMHNYYLD